MGRRAGLVLNQLGNSLLLLAIWNQNLGVAPHLFVALRGLQGSKQRGGGNAGRYCGRFDAGLV